MYRLEEHEESIPGVKRILLAWIDENIVLLTAETDERDNAVHESRKNFKRMRAALRLIRFAIGEHVFKRENAVFRDASRLLAPLRDSTVLVETLDNLKTCYADELPRDAFLSVREKLVAEQMRKRQIFFTDQDAPGAVVAVLQAARPRMAALPVSQDGFEAFDAGLQRVYARCRLRMARAYALPDHAELFHDWRKRVKYLWHQMEILQLVWPQVQDAVAEELHQISTYLGDAHDLVVLRETIEARSDYFGEEGERPLLFTLLSKRQNELETAALPLGKRLFSERPRDFRKRYAAYFETWQRFGVNGAPPKVTAVAGQLISTQEAALELGISVAQVRRLMQEGQLKAAKIGNIWVASRDDVANLADSYKALFGTARTPNWAAFQAQ